MIPWNDIMKFGFGYLKLSPDAFWDMTLRELDAAIEWSFPKQRNQTAPTTSNLAYLIETYPDK